MCGICGYFGNHAFVSAEALQRMNQALIRRGPDDSGMFQDAGVGLAMRRLSIIDLEGGAQPIHNEDATIWVVFNGEIYNYRELRVKLEQCGHRFRTNSDTEVLVHLYEEYGDEFVEHLRGMFAFALWDAPRRRGLIVRDRLGIKPLFVAEVDGTLLFGSEIKSLLASGLIDRTMDHQALDAFFAFTYIPAPLTIYRGIRKLEPGHLLIYESGKVEQRRYWDLDVSNPDDADGNERECLTQFDTAIEDAVAAHMVSDVPIGAFLSGGIDSSLVVALMSRHAQGPVQTFTMGFDGASGSLLDERPLAAAVAARYECNYHDYAVQPDFRGIVGELVDAFDEPFADDSIIPSYYVSQFTRSEVKVALSGLGGDELFAGYARYSGVLLSQYYAAAVPQVLHRKLVEPLVRRFPEPAHGGDRTNHAKRFAASVLQGPAERYLGFISTMTACQRAQAFAPELAAEIDFGATDRMITEPYNRCGGRDDVSRAIYVDMKTYLPEDILALSDRLSMWHSLEVRVPLVDHELVERSARLPTRYKIDMRRKKILLRKIAQQYLPREVIAHRKQGFESPMAAWLRSDLAGYARDVLGAGRLGKTGLFNPAFVSARLEEHLAGRQRNNKLLFSLIMFQEWYERHWN